MFCHECGTKTESGKKFCPNCGAQLIVSSNDHAAPSNTTAQQASYVIPKVPTAPRKKKPRKAGLIIGMIAAVLVASALGIFLLPPLVEYASAMDLLEKNRYEEAIEAFDALGDYRDAMEQLRIARYHFGLELLNDGTFEDAAAQFAQTDDYKDSEKFEEYARAMQYLENGDRFAALLKLRSPDAFEDARTKTIELLRMINAQCPLSASMYHTVELKADGTVVATGNNDHGQCDVGTWDRIKDPHRP